MVAPNDSDDLARIVGRVMAVEETTLGGPKQTFAFRARGRLTVDSGTAYDQLEAAGKPFGLTPILREENGRQEILFVKGLSAKGTGNPRVNLILFLLTLASVVYTAAVSAVPASAVPCTAEPTAEDAWKTIAFALQWGLTHLDAGLPFALSFLAVLGSHELGHYLAGRRNGTAVTLPFFIPLPPLISPFGTMGAVISMRGAPKNRNALAEIGIAGPLTGFLVGLPLLLAGLSLSRVEPLSTALGPCESYFMEGNSILYLLAKLTVFGKILPAPAQFDIPPALFYLRSFFIGYPLSTAGLDVRIHDIAFGAWAGLMITGLNLIPAGQLDGGHLLYVLLGKRAGRYLPWIIGGLCILGFFWPGWFLLAFLVLIFGRVHAEPLDTVTPLSRRNRALALFGLILFLLLFTPVPLQVSGG
jgi:hypothetical protein